MSEQKTAYPLCWPDGWPRTNINLRQASRFFSGKSWGKSVDEATRGLQLELDRIKAKDAILSTNVRLKLNGLPYSTGIEPSDVGVAVYFKLKKRDVSLACDKWNRVGCNIWSITKHIEALRGQERWGVGNIEQAFRGYMALPGVGESSGDRPWEILEIPINAGEEQIKDAWRTLAKRYHPDNPETGDSAQFTRIQHAADLLLQNLNGNS